jgi:hypothetical protein
MKTLCKEMGVAPSYISAFRNNKKEISHIAKAGIYYYLLCKAFQQGIQISDTPNLKTKNETNKTTLAKSKQNPG